MSERPRLHSGPVLAHPDLMCCRCFAGLAHTCVAENVVGVTEDLLAQSIDAVVDVVQGRGLRNAELKFSDCCPDFLLWCSLVAKTRIVSK